MCNLFFSACPHARIFLPVALDEYRSESRDAARFDGSFMRERVLVWVVFLKKKKKKKGEEEEEEGNEKEVKEREREQAVP